MQEQLMLCRLNHIVYGSMVAGSFGNKSVCVGTEVERRDEGGLLQYFSTVFCCGLQLFARLMQQQRKKENKSCWALLELDVFLRQTKQSGNGLYGQAKLSWGAKLNAACTSVCPPTRLLKPLVLFDAVWCRRAWPLLQYTTLNRKYVLCFRFGFSCGKAFIAIVSTTIKLYLNLTYKTQLLHLLRYSVIYSI